MSSQIAEPAPSPSPPHSFAAEPCTGHPAGGGFQCLDVPELKRLQYFFGQVLGPQDFRDEQSYFREKLKLHNRCLHGFGVVCGLVVVPVPPSDECELRARLEREIEELKKKAANPLTTPAEKEALKKQIAELEKRLQCLPPPCNHVRIRCGLAYDCAGNELVVRRDLIVDLSGETAGTLWLSLCFCEQPADPSRPVLPDACGASPDCVFGKLRDAVRVRVSKEEPPKDESCDSCCSGCADPCVLLARINDFIPGQPVTADQILNEVRRPITPYLATRVEGVSWTHGATYNADEAFLILEELKIHFTRPIRTSTLRRGVVDVWVIEGGSGRRANIYNREGTIIKPEPPKPETDTLIFHSDSDESLQDGDRVLITVRTSFLLDDCCRPVDGENIGGRVPRLPKSLEGTLDDGPLPACLKSPGSSLSSGNGSPAGTFESWFFVKDVVPVKRQRGGMPK